MKSMYGCIFDEINDNTDILCANLETCITDETKRIKKTYNFRLDPQYSKILKFNCNQVYNLANNHIMDYGKKGIVDTIDHLDNLDIYHVGAGVNSLQAEEPTIIQIDNLRIGFIGATDQMLSWEARNDSPGVNILDYSDTHPLLKQIRSAKDDCDFLVVNLHWGENWNSDPHKDQINFVNDAINNGADAIIGTSSHFPHNLRIKDHKKIIMYGMGDFIDDYALNKYYRNDLGVVLNLDIVDKGDGDIFVKNPVLIPVKINNRSVNTISNPLECLMGLRFINL
jgi:poly-gamma-glutamate synthesis protein (capsule biosynthesis protein)